MTSSIQSSSNCVPDVVHVHMQRGIHSNHACSTAAVKASGREGLKTRLQSGSAPPLMVITKPSQGIGPAEPNCTLFAQSGLSNSGQQTSAERGCDQVRALGFEDTERRYSHPAEQRSWLCARDASDPAHLGNRYIKLTAASIDPPASRGSALAAF